MTESPFKLALDRSGVSVEDFADLVGVDPKTVQRWIAGASTPYRRHRGAIARALDTPIHELWPAENPPSVTDAQPERDLPSPEEVVRSWGGQEHPDFGDLLTDAHHVIDVLAASATQLNAPTFVPTLGRAADRGCQIRILAPEAGLAFDSIARLVAHPNVQLHLFDRFVAHTIYRADDRVMLGVWLAGIEGQPFLLAKRQRDHGLFDTITSHFQKLWEISEPPAPSTSTNEPARDEPPSPHDTQGPSRRVRRWPTT